MELSITIGIIKNLDENTSQLQSAGLTLLSAKTSVDTVLEVYVYFTGYVEPIIFLLCEHLILMQNQYSGMLTDTTLLALNQIRCQGQNDWAPEVEGSVFICNVGFVPPAISHWLIALYVVTCTNNQTGHVWGVRRCFMMANDTDNVMYNPCDMVTLKNSNWLTSLLLHLY